MKLIISKPAEEDLREIYTYIASDNPSAASKMVEVFRRSFDILIGMPRAGSKRLDLTEKDVLFYVIKKRYLVVYTKRDNNLIILRVLTTYQDICSLF